MTSAGVVAEEGLDRRYQQRANRMTSLRFLPEQIEQWPVAANLRHLIL